MKSGSDAVGINGATLVWDCGTAKVSDDLSYQIHFDDSARTRLTCTWFGVDTDTLHEDALSAVKAAEDDYQAKLAAVGRGPQVDQCFEYGSPAEGVCGHCDQKSKANLVRDRDFWRAYSQRIATEAKNGFGALEDIDAFWEACGYPNNRKVLTVAEQTSSLVRELDNALNEIAGLKSASMVTVSVKPMKLSDERFDYFVSFASQDRECTPHSFKDRYKAEYHVAFYRWFFEGGVEPDILAFDDGEWPARTYTDEERRAFAALASCADKMGVEDGR